MSKADHAHREAKTRAREGAGENDGEGSCKRIPGELRFETETLQKQCGVILQNQRGSRKGLQHMVRPRKTSDSEGNKARRLAMQVNLAK
jgi:hypothetical protein